LKRPAGPSLILGGVHSILAWAAYSARIFGVVAAGKEVHAQVIEVVHAVLAAEGDEEGSAVRSASFVLPWLRFD